MNETPVDIVYSKRYSILAAVMVGAIMGPIDASIVNVVLPTIAQYFGVGVSAAEWVPMVYLLTIGSLLLFYGRLGDILGYKKIYLTGLAGFIVMSALCGLSPSIHWLIVFRALQGLSAGMLMSMPFAILTAVFPPHERGKALGINAISVSAGLALGPSLGGFLTSLLGWRFVFLINVPIGIAGLFWGSRIIPNIRGRRARIDLPGVLLGCLSLLFLLLFINRFHSSRTGPLTVFLLFCSIAAVAAFLKAESSVPEPMLNLGLFRSMTFSLANISALLNFMAQYIMVFLTPFYLQRVLHFEPDRMGLIMTSFPLAVMAVAPFSVVVVVAQSEDTESAKAGESVYEQLTAAGIEVIIDDRAERAGVKFRDAELTGIPLRVTVGKRGLAEGVVEVTKRVTGETAKVGLGDILPHIREALAAA